MSRNISVNGQIYSLPDLGDEGWDDESFKVSDFFDALAQYTLQPIGGAFTLTLDDVNFGPRVRDKRI